MSKSFGFAQFQSLEDAQAFLEPNFPFITLPAPSYVPPGGLTTPDEDRIRRVKIDYSQSANPNVDPSRVPRVGPRAGYGTDANDGTRDIGSAHVPVILLRGLDTVSTPENIAQSLRESEGPGKKSAKGLRRVILIRDRASKISTGIAFVEFVDTRAASIVLANTMSPTLFPNGFRISDIPVAASFAHPHSFRLTPDDVPRDDSCVNASEALGGRDSGFARYWDENVVISELVCEVEEDKPAPKVKDKRKEKMKEKAPTKSAPKPTGLDTTAAPVSMSFKPKLGGLGSKIKLSGNLTENKLASTSAAFGDEDEDQSAAEDANADESQDRTTSYRRVAPMIASKKVSNNIMKWNTVQGALHSEGETEASTPPTEIPQPVILSNFLRFHRAL
ncbi:hypothetical protein DL93DRAFT_2072756 [Clavulina sp. PMI_390]|nr:hypothetical protein DL93DRAFT_2072756 [Clavulina sp. PMI_390]